jgi:FAD/FMN-containing dehydrogenase
LRLTDLLPPSQVMLFAVPEMAALMRVFAVCRAKLNLSAFEFFTDRALHHVVAHGAQNPFAEISPYYVVTEFDAGTDAQQQAALDVFEQCLSEGWVADGAMSQSDAQAAALWRLREGITESLASLQPYKNDISVRVAAVPEFLDEMQALLKREYPHFEVVWFGHIGDGNLHINVCKPGDIADADFVAQCERVTKLLSDVLARHGGSISAEHGIGLVKKAYLAGTRSAAEIALMRGLRKVFDPLGIMNPGKLFD